MLATRRLYAWNARRKLGQRLQVVGMPRIDTTSTLLLSNHTTLKDYDLVAAAFYNTIQEVPRVILRDDVFHPDEKENGRALHKPECRKMDMARHKLFYFFAKNLIDAIPIRRSDSAYPKGMHSPREYLKAICRGEDVLMFPTGKISRSGAIDEVPSWTTPFKDEDITHLMERNNHLHVAFIHLVRDPVFDKYCVSLGDSYTAQDSKALSFAREIGKCTSLTGLQIYHFMKREGINLSLKDAIIRLRDKRYAVVPNVTASEIEERVLAYQPEREHPEENLGLNGDTIRVASPDYQYNSVAHIRNELESVLKTG